MLKRRELLWLIAATVVLLALLLVFLRPTDMPQTETPDFSQYPAGSERKSAFFGYFLPLVEARNQEIIKLRDEVQGWYQQRDKLSSSKAKKVQALAEQYRISDFKLDDENHWQTLLRRLDVVPPSMALAQAANESAWGTSRFAKEANNYYGQWCFTKGCGVVPNQRSEGLSHEVATFASPADSVRSYIRNINTHQAYADLRRLRAELRSGAQPITGIELAKGLGRYSERGEEYISELQDMIRHNQLDQYDSH